MLITRSAGETRCKGEAPVMTSGGVILSVGMGSDGGVVCDGRVADGVMSDGVNAVLTF